MGDVMHVAICLHGKLACFYFGIIIIHYCVINKKTIQEDKYIHGYNLDYKSKLIYSYSYYIAIYLYVRGSENL